MDGELPHHRLARAGGRAYQHTVAVLERPTCALLEVVKGERKLLGESGEFAAKWRRHRLLAATRLTLRSAARSVRHRRSSRPHRLERAQAYPGVPCVCRGRERSESRLPTTA